MYVLVNEVVRTSAPAVVSLTLLPISNNYRLLKNLSIMKNGINNNSYSNHPSIIKANVVSTENKINAIIISEIC